MNQMPEIQSIGSPPEKHADRVVLEMLKVIAGARQLTWPEIRDIVGQCPDGNPKAQAKMLEKLKVANPFTVGTQLIPGKRGRYELYFLDAHVWNPATRDVMAPLAAIPKMPWLAFMIIKLTSKGGHRYAINNSIALLITHHALSRLTQRCGARTIQDVWFAAREIGATYFSTELSTESRDHTRLRVPLPHEMGTVICALQSSDNNAVVATLWQEDEQG
jgi:hypothetical protein